MRRTVQSAGTFGQRTSQRYFGRLNLGSLLPSTYTYLGDCITTNLYCKLFRNLGSPKNLGLSKHHEVRNSMMAMLHLSPLLKQLDMLCK